MASFPVNAARTATPRWSSRSLGSRFQHGVFRWLVRLRAMSLARGLLAVVVFYYTLLPHVRRRCMPYVRRRFGVKRGRQAFAHARRLYAAFGDILLERMCAGVAGRIPGEAGDAAAREVIARALSRGRGCLLLSAHVGAWQLGLAALDTGQTPVHILLWRDPGDVDRHYFEEGHGKALRVIDAARPVEALVSVTAALRQGHIVAIMGDRSMDSATLSGKEATVAAPFWGETAFFPVKPYALASITGAPLIMALTVRDGGVIRPFLCEEIPVPSGVNHRDTEQFSPCARRFVQGLERLTAAYPYQFYNFHNLWLDAHDRTGNTGNA